MGSTYERSFAKGLCWEIISFIITTFAVYLIYGNFYFSLKFSFVLGIIKVLIFFMHERLWKQVKWGKVK